MMRHIWVENYLALKLASFYDGTYLGRDIFGLNFLQNMMGHIWVGTYLALITFRNDGTYLGWDIFGLNYLNYMLGHIWVRDINGSRTYLVRDIFGTGTYLAGHKWGTRDIFGLRT